MANDLLELLSSDLPVLAAPMAGGPTTPALVVAAAEAGSAGFLAGGYKSPDALAAEVAEVKGAGLGYGVNLFAPKGTAGARALFRAIGRGESVSLMADQKFNGGVAAPLFGVMAHTAPGPSTYALKFGIPLLPMSVQRLEKARFKVIVHEPIHLADTGDRDADIEAGVRAINAFIEGRILARPTEWFWVHRRWPGEFYKRRKK